jgi:hypothetical protein
VKELRSTNFIGSKNSLPQILCVASTSRIMAPEPHGGRIDVETEPGVFTEFIITLPRNGSTVNSRKAE